MIKKHRVYFILATSCLASLNSYANSTVDAQLQLYQQQGATASSAERGRSLWYSKSADRSCTRCHTDSPVNVGKHVKTGKAIQPMAASANPERYRDAKKIEKWFLRNCKWTLGRECSVQEKSDILFWLNSQ